MSAEALKLAVRLGQTAATEAPYTEDGLAGIIKCCLIKEGYSIKTAEPLAEEAAHAVFAGLTIPALLACDAQAASFGWADPGRTHRERQKTQSPSPCAPPPPPLTAVGENFVLF